MNNDYGYLKMAAHDRMTVDGMTGEEIPYCLVNAERFFVPDADLSKLLHKTSEERLRDDDGKSLEEFVNRMDVEKLLWRPLEVDHRPSRLMARKSVSLSGATSNSIINTGMGPLAVGEKIYALPAVGVLVKNNPSVNTFVMNGEMYLHPMLINWKERDNLLNDVLALDMAAEAKTVTIIGGLIKKTLNKVTNKLDVSRLINYLRMIKPLGLVLYNLAGNRTSICDVGENNVVLGAGFICGYNQF